MELCFNTIDEYVKMFSQQDTYASGKCSCGGIQEMELSLLKVKIADLEIVINSCPRTIFLFPLYKLR